MAVLLKIVRVKGKHLTLFKYKYVNHVRAFRAFHRLKSHHQHRYPRKLKRKMLPPVKHQLEKVNHVKRKMLHHREVDDVMHHLHHQIQSNIYSSLLSLTIALFRSEAKRKYLAGSKDLIHRHVGTKVSVSIAMNIEA